MKYSETIENHIRLPSGTYYGTWQHDRVNIKFGDQEYVLLVTKSIRGQTKVTVLVDNNLIDIYCGWS